MHQPFFSICIPNYNYAGYIGKTIESVLNQEYQNFEIIIVDNASTDNSWEVITDYAKKDSRIKTFRNEYNVGFAPNLDRAAQRASHDFIIMLSSDDLMHTDALKTYAHILEQAGDKAEACLVTSAVDIIDQDDQLIRKQFRDEYHDVPLSTWQLPMQDSDVTVHDGLNVFKAVFPIMGTAGPFCATMFSRRTYNRVGGYGSVNLIGPDAHFIFKALLLDLPLVFVNRPLFSYRIHAASQLGQAQKKLNINVLLDRYIFSNAYSDAQLEKAGVKREDVIKYIVNETCLNAAFREVRNGRYTYAYRHLCFAFAAYPGYAVRNYKSFLLFIAIIMGPVSKFILGNLFPPKKTT